MILYIESLLSRGPSFYPGKNSLFQDQPGFGTSAFLNGMEDIKSIVDDFVKNPQYDYIRSKIKVF
jgi:hypothetical protein